MESQFLPFLSYVFYLGPWESARGGTIITANDILATMNNLYEGFSLALKKSDQVLDLFELFFF